MTDHSIASGSPYLNVAGSRIGRIKGVPDDDMHTIRRLLKVWRDHYPRNLLRSAFYDGKQRFNNLGISIPNIVAAKAGVVVGWPQKSVRALADKSVFEGFETPDGDPDGIARIVTDNALTDTMGEAIISCYKHSCSFLTIDYDPDDPSGERILVTPRSADWSAAIWDNTRHRIAAALTVTDNDQWGNMTAFNAWLPGRNYACRHDAGGWNAERQDNRLGRVAVVPIVYDRGDRPFGHSRINRTLMNLTDMAMRTMIRMEASAEFYSVPKIWFLGLNRDAFSQDTWSSLVSSINAVSRDENGDVPTLQQVTQASMQPHGAMLETIAMLASAETGIPAEQLGIRLTNPTSAEALAAAEDQLTRIADRQNRAFGVQLMNAMSMAVQLRDNTADPPDLTGIRPLWAPTRVVSEAALADYYVKVAGANPAWADSDTGLARLGLSADERRSFRAYQQRVRAQEHIDQLRARALQPQRQAGDATARQTAVSADASQPVDAQTPPDELKSRFDALGVAVRAGVEPEDAANRLGLAGIRFTGMVPVNLKEVADGESGSGPAVGRRPQGTGSGAGTADQGVSGRS
ncbi:phage portal protein gp6-like protein [Bifidobacterium margollesii]|uniref:Phage portal protein gp6-like protein n=1 Tax=Bifidobacterium margollesii TaxID=2020964 RepID=A0A2N5J7B1_9BIFI|nr:phage portal protein [Bifidobacterium margollesii]PLS30092.1 phage portal protein gp6-like protein [Bifidobacterium margollesii]